MSLSSISDFDSDAGDISLSVPSSSNSIFLSTFAPHEPSRLPFQTHHPTGKLHPNPLLHPNETVSPTPLAKPMTAVDEDEVSTPRPWLPKPQHVEEDMDPVTPTKFTRQFSGSLGRSKSLNIRLPSIDLPVPGPVSSSSYEPKERMAWNRRPGEARPPPLLDDDLGRRMGRWIQEIVVCNFDLERGPVVERRAVGRRWGPGEKENVAFSSFPDTSLFAEGNIMFSFKIRHIPPDPASLSQPEPVSPMPDRVASMEANFQGMSMEQGSTVPMETPAAGSAGMSKGEKAEEYRKWDERGREWLYGYVWFEQRKDKDLVRGYMQKSLVILTHLPFPSLFFTILERIGPPFFQHGYSALEAACHSIATWQDPSPNALLELPLMSDVITCQLPDTGESPQVGNIMGLSSPERPILVTLPQTSPLRALAPVLPSLWSIWECLILAEPILVIAPDPKTCSEIVWWLRDLIRPIPPAGDFRPYLHIHDHDFALLVNSNKPQAGVVVGVTNPFFRNAASHWPNVISLPTPSRRPLPSSTSGDFPRPDQPVGFLSRRHRSVQKDRPLLKRLQALVDEGNLDEPSANEALRTHFQQLTDKMLVPLNRYFQTLVPTLSPSPSISPGYIPTPFTPLSTSSTPGGGGGTETLKPFSLPNFLTHLKSHGPNPLSFRTRGLSSKSRVEGDFYTSFCMSPTFAGWLSARVEKMGIAVANTRGDPILSTSGSWLTHLAPPPSGVRRSSAPGVGLGFNLPPGVKVSAVAAVERIQGEGSVREEVSGSEDDSSASGWRESDESNRDVLGDQYYLRRVSEGAVKVLRKEG
ncbi:hypothetical protein TREMEDRAFT_41513 [Tremella mesenterica DSM 1558]|uniref:uncharacterized protein n=1 Tax=Tremella mesenterica (strain ATCC 24925 / CBS 8224 / DSM 1558 / NBRC 9311 / NRRL Y-6157 / RJB 2259-6 / UBC 559-6) TaxID=578456 RepID=UPI0003F49456|nr:uncharacterized protein TREMEDRAFT_41513 [Tremella mesenterica DSM 1558]EIW72107.1 hypothetical protein TREMEDRAFT_41513 [Tremella mesenterica DSM 1558]